MKHLAFTLLMAMSALAQSSLEIVGAYYGIDDRFADVTARLRVMQQQSRGGGLAVAVSPNAFGGLDPARGIGKVLRIYYRVNGQLTNGEWRDGEMARIGEINEPQRGRRDGGLTIVKASYGAGRRIIDVTSLIQQRVRDNRVDLQITNQTMGGVDPAPAVVKELLLTFEDESGPHDVRIRESEWLRIPLEQASNPATGLHIIKAVFGTDSRNADVTTILRSLVANDRLTLTVGPNTLAVDPARGEDRMLHLVYLWNGQQVEARVNEGRVLDVPPKEGAPGQRPSPSLYASATDAVCLFAEPNYEGQSYCVAIGQPAQQMPSFARYGSVRFKGRVRQADLYELPGYKGKTVRLQGSQADLTRFEIWATRPGSLKLN